MKCVTSLQPRPSLPSSKAIVWLTDTECVQPGLLPHYEMLLDEEEQQRYRAFRFDDDRQLYLISHALLRTTLSRYSEVAPSDWRFAKGEFGRPKIATRNGGNDCISFSLSHTRSLAACAVTHVADVGVDVERLDRKVDGLAIASNCFSRHEMEQLEALPKARRQTRFFKYWTLKEAYVKARGGGLSIPLDRFHFYRDPTGAWRIAFDTAADEDAADWQFVCVPVMTEYVLSIAIYRPDRLRSDVELRSTVPLLSDASSELPIYYA